MGNKGSKAYGRQTTVPFVTGGGFYRFISMNCTESGKNFDGISSFQLGSEIEKIVGAIKSLKRTRSGLILEVFSKEQSLALLDINEFLKERVIVTPDKDLSVCKGVISSNYLNCTEEEIITGFAEYHVISAQRLKEKGQDGEWHDTSSIILTFLREELPATVTAGYETLDVSPYSHTKNKKKKKRHHKRQQKVPPLKIRINKSEKTATIIETT